jgi:hypothetical protein
MASGTTGLVARAMTTEELRQRRQRLLTARAECLAKMSAEARRAFEQRVDRPLRQQPEKCAPAAPANCAEAEVGRGALLTHEIKNLIAEAHRLRGRAEQGRDIRTAMKGLDTALKALELFGRVTGEIRNQNAASVTVNVVATREEGIQTAADLLLELASAAELVLLIGQLQQRLVELEHLPEFKTALPKAAEPTQPQLPAATPPERKEAEEENG